MRKLSKVKASASWITCARIMPFDDPRHWGKPLRGSKLGSLWRYRVGDYRIICDLQDRRLVILVVQVGHRREIYL